MPAHLGSCMHLNLQVAAAAGLQLGGTPSRSPFDLHDEGGAQAVPTGVHCTLPGSASSPCALLLPRLCAAGAVRAVAVHPSAEVVASVGLDRHLRLHSTHSRQLLARVYCKTLPTGAVQRYSSTAVAWVAWYKCGAAVRR